MREVIAVCRSSKRSRVRVAAVLDRYFWRIGDRTWRGRASNACLDRVARELRTEAKRNTAVVIHEIRSARESRVPIVRIGSKSAFSAEGVVPVATHAARTVFRVASSQSERSRLAIVQIAVLFHDLGKATILFQDKLRRSLKKNAKPEADPVRHDLFSAVVWDLLCGALDDSALIVRLRSLTPAEIDKACVDAVPRLARFHANHDKPMELAFAEHGTLAVSREGSIAHAVGMLILTHHRLPDGSSNHLRLQANRHVKADVTLNRDDLGIAQGTTFWRDQHWLSRLARATDNLCADIGVPGLDLALRATLMFADHLGSALKEPSSSKKVHLGNTTKEKEPGDPLDLHIRRVVERVPGCFHILHRHRESYPALGEEQVPLDIRLPAPAAEPFAWQATAALATRELCKEREGGFFACLMAGTGTGKTRGAPVILAAAAFADARSERRYLRFSLALGLRSLATQSAREYADDLGFSANDVSVLIGQPPVEFRDGQEPDPPDDGSLSLIALPEWLRVERAEGDPPAEGDPREADWLRRLSYDTDRGLPATLDLVIEKAGGNQSGARRLISAPVMVGTVDHLMGVATPTNSRFLLQAVRVLSSDLILDEIDQYDGEDIAAIGRLVYQTAAGGRRVIIMSATLTADVADALSDAYRAGWRVHAAASGTADHVNFLCCGDAAGTCVTNVRGEEFSALYETCRQATVTALAARPPQRIGRILPPCEDWPGLVSQIDAECHALHDTTAVRIDGVRVSVGLVRMTRISHTAALAVQLPAGPCDGRLRLKLCLHSQFPRLHRQWIERELKRALTRKGGDPDKGLRELCQRHDLIRRVHEHGCRELEIVVVTSPVIETGNDLDFDWAILDPASMRAIVQAAGRVWRHRPFGGTAANVAIFGRSAIVMQTQVLAMPGVETRPHKDTFVQRVDLAAFPSRHVADLIGPEILDVIDARAVLGDNISPLRQAESRLRQDMISTSADAPLGTYVRAATARLNRRITESRKFRRSETRDLLYCQLGAQWDCARWHLDRAAGTRDSELVDAERHGLTVAPPTSDYLLFDDLNDLSWQDYLSGRDLEPGDVRRLMEVQVPDYGVADPPMSWHEWTGFVRGKPNDLFEPFGKSVSQQGLSSDARKHR